MNIVDPVLRYGMRHGWNRGVVEGKSAWVVIGGVALAGYLGRRVMHREAEVVFLEKLAPGQSIRITHEAAP